MSISPSMLSGVTGVNVFQSGLTVIGNNIANTDTIGFKEGAISFAEIISEEMTGPFQFGMGALVNDVRTRFTQGAIERTGNPLDLALDGNGFFVLKDPDGLPISFLTRAGAFKRDSKGLVVNADGLQLQAFKLDAEGKATGELGAIDFSLNQQSPPKATSKVNVTLNLFSGTQDPTTVVTSETATVLDPIEAGDFTINGVPVAAIDPGETAEEQADNIAAAINDITDETGVTVERVGTSVKLTQIHGGPITIGFDLDQDQDLAAKTGFTAGVFLNDKDAQTGQTIARVLTGNVMTDAGSKTVRGLDTRFKDEIKAGDSIVIGTNSYNVESVQSNTELTLTAAATATITEDDDPVTATARFSNFSTAISVFDSQGAEHLVNVVFRKTGTNVWEWNAIVNKNDNLNGNFDQVQANGTMTFTDNGVLQDATPQLSPTDGFDFKVINLNTNEAEASLDPSPNQQIAFDFSTGITQFGAKPGSVVLSQTQDGFSSGQPQSMSVDEDGFIIGLFSNGKSKKLGQLAIAMVPNEEGLTRIGSNLYNLSTTSGEETLNVANVSGRGRIEARSLEISNVDLAAQFVKLITYQRGFQANSRVITTSDEVLQEVVNLKR